MNKNILIPLLVVIFFAGIWWFSIQTLHKTVNDETVITNSHTREAPLKRPEFTLTDIDGRPQSISNWNEHVILLNFWATWCPPCRKEMPDFIEVYDEYKDQGFVVIGIGIDNTQQIIDFVDSLGVEYPILVGERDAMNVSQEYGNRHGALPYSVIIDRQGMIRYKMAGLISKKQLLAWITPLL